MVYSSNSPGQEVSLVKRHSANCTPENDEVARWPAELAAYKRLPAGEAEAFLDRVGERTGRGRAAAAEADEVWMTWAQAREMRDAGMSFGGHTVNHPILASLPTEGQEEEIRGCSARLAAELGTTMRAFSYPVGSPDAFDATTTALVRAAGCEAAQDRFRNGESADPCGRKLDTWYVPARECVRPAS